MTDLHDIVSWHGRGPIDGDGRGGGTPTDQKVPKTAYELLAGGRSLGKKVSLLVNTSNSTLIVNPPNVNILEVRGPDAAAMNLQFTITPPRIVQIDGINLTVARAQGLVDAQQVSGTVSFNDQEVNFSDPAFPNGVAATPVIATIDWGIGGVSTERAEVDIMNGVNVNLTASFLRIGISVDPLLAKMGVPAGTTAIYELGGFVGPGYTKPNNAQRTIYMGGINPAAGSDTGTSGFVPIPRYATECTVAIGSGDSSGAGFGTDVASLVGNLVQIVFFSAYGDIFGGGYTPPISPTIWPPCLAAYTIADNGNGNRTVKIPNGAYYAAIRNNSDFTIYPNLIFGLGI